LHSDTRTVRRGDEQVTGFRVLVADDDQAVRESLDRLLRYEGYEVDLAGDGAEALVQAMTHVPDAVILDVLMPAVDGFQACRSLRVAGNKVPILMLTARDGVRDRVDGLDAGADDFVGKPFALEELLARLRALLRRSVPAPAGPRPGTAVYADVVLNRDTRQVFRAGRPIELTRTEFNLLDVFLTHPGQVLTRGRLFDAVWGYEPNGSNTLDVYVGYLRRKLEAGGGPRLLHTQRGVGFVLRRNGADEAS
jgi:two-component system response regulator MprA